MNEQAATFARLTSGTRTFALRGRSPFAQGVMALSALVVMAVLLPLLLLLALAVLAVFGLNRLKRRVRGLRAPNGALDGRRNVRVRVPGAESI